MRTKFDKGYNWLTEAFSCDSIKFPVLFTFTLLTVPLSTFIIYASLFIAARILCVHYSFSTQYEYTMLLHDFIPRGESR